jgi:uncharacterized protein
LLDVQDLDVRADQLRHRRASLPALAEIAELQRDRRQLDEQARDQQIVVEDLDAEQRKIDGDVEQVKTRRARDRDRMDKGLISNPKDLERMGHELESLERRITSLEDTELEVMERLEETQTELEKVTSELAGFEERTLTLTTARDLKSGGIRDEVTALERERAAAAAGLPDDLMTLYQRLREQKNGVGAAALTRGECGGCRLSMNAADLRAMAAAPSDEVIRCEECQRILVRTADSGL